VCVSVCVCRLQHRSTLSVPARRVYVWETYVGDTWCVRLRRRESERVHACVWVRASPPLPMEVDCPSPFCVCEREWVCMRQRKGEREGEKATECVCVCVCWCRLQHRGTICVKIVRLFITRLCVCIHKESMCVCVYTLRLTQTNTLTCKRNEDTHTHGMHTSTRKQHRPIKTKRTRKRETNTAKSH